jgi:hypothetical protein
MIKDREKRNSAIEVDLSGPQGNAHWLIGYAGKLSKQLGLDSKAVQAEMMQGDCEHLVQTFDKYFDEYVTLYR